MENIKACIRIKPILTKSEEEVICGKYGENAVINYKTQEVYSFEQVFDSDTTTDKIFSCIGESLIDSCFEGVNVCVFAYGQTSSGKTHTMKGDKTSPGFIPQALTRIFQKILENHDRSYEIRCSYMEIYNENVNDLLNPTNFNLEIRENLTKGIHIPGLTEMAVQTQREALQFFEMGESARKVGETCLNEQSSRSHTIFRISLESRSKLQADKIIFSTVNLVDLAGSEGVSRTKAEGLRKKEGANINKSLLALSNVISKLASKEVSYINYRDSKLTRLLQPCLGGNSRTVVICTINPLLLNYQETLNTLKFGMSAGAIKNQVQVNERVSGCTALSKDQLREYNELKASISKSKELFDNMLVVHTNKIEELEKTIQMLHEECEEAKQTLNQQREETIHYMEECAKKDEEIERLNKKHDSLLERIAETESKVREEFERKTEVFEKAYAVLDRKLIELKQDNAQLISEKQNLLSELDKNDRIRHAMKEEKDKLIKIHQEQVETLKKKLETLVEEGLKKLSVEKDGSNAHYFNLFSEGLAEGSVSKNVTADYEMKFLEMETQLKSQLIQKNKMIIEMNNQTSELSNELRRRDERIFDLENQIYLLKMQTPFSQRMINKENDHLEGLEVMEKRRKIDGNAAFASLSIGRQPGKSSLTKGIKGFPFRRSVRKGFSMKKQLEEENQKKMQELTNNPSEMENQLASNLSLFDRNF